MTTEAIWDLDVPSGDDDLHRVLLERERKASGPA